MTDTVETSLVERAKALAPAIAERTAWVEENRRVHDDTIQELVDSGLTRALQSRQYGGLEANPADFYKATVEISKACTSSGWILTLLGVHSWEMAHMSKELNEELFGEDPTTLIASSYAIQGNKAERVPGGYRLSGRWKSSSGIDHSEWVVLGAHVDGVVYLLLVPKSDITLDDDWFVLGMVGTGSQSIIADDVFVPEHRAIEQDIVRAGYGPGSRDNHGPLFRMPQAYIYSTVSSAAVLGAGWRFYEEYKKQYGKATTFSRAFEGDRLMMTRLAEARGALSVSEIVPVHRLNEGYQAAVEGREMTDLEVAQGMYDIAGNGRRVHEMVTMLYPTLRPSAIYKTNILERLYRDIIVARQHGTSSTDERAEPLAAADLGLSASYHFLVSPEQRERAHARAQELGYID